MTPVPGVAVEHIAQACRNHLASFGSFVHGLQPAKHHTDWLRDLRVVADQGGKLLLMAPPGWAKSTWLMIFMEWLLGNHPGWSVLFLTSADDRAMIVNTAVRTMLESERYALVFPDPACRPDKERGWSGAGLWLKGTPQDSVNPAFKACGFTANYIGSRPHLIVLDDPRNQEQAQSETEQAAAKALHDGTIVSRLHPDKPMEVVISTRWHANDLIGHLMDQGGWTVRSVPALDENEQSTWPERFSTEYVLEMRRLLGTALFRTIWMNDPTSQGGAFYREEKWFRPLPADFDKRGGYGKKTKRESLTVVQFWDLAYSAKDTADYSACVTMGQDSALNVYVLGAWRGKRDEGGLAQAIVDQYEMYQPVGIGVERGIWDKSQAVKDVLRQVRQQIMVGPWLIEAKGTKEERALLPAGLAENGQFFMDMEAPWAHDYKAELLAFNLGKNDDWCFVAGTKIATPTGDRPIEDMQVGDMVITPFGCRKVLAAGPTGVKPTIVRRTLEGTGNHPVWANDDWRQMDTLTWACRVSTMRLWDLIRWQSPRRSSFLGSRIASWAASDSTTSVNPRRTLNGRKPRAYMSPSGSTSVGRLRRVGAATASIIRMATRSITITGIWSCYRASNIPRSIHSKIQNVSVAIWRQFSLSQRLGIQALRVVHGIGSMQFMSPLSVSLNPASVRLAGGVSCPSGQPSPSSVRLDAVTDGAGALNMVYNLTIEGSHCYYANGILVHNCDATSGAAELFRSKMAFMIDLKKLPRQKYTFKSAKRPAA